MRQEDIFAAAIGVKSPWTITKVNLEIGDGELHIEIDFPSGSEFEYRDEATGRTSLLKAYDSSVKTWRHMNFFQYRCYLHARIPRVRTEGGKIEQVTAPWEGAVGGFTMLFEAFILQPVKAMPVHQVCRTSGSCGMSPALSKGVVKNLPKGEIAFDRFNAVKIMDDAVGKVRKVLAKMHPLLRNCRCVLTGKLDFARINPFCATHALL